MLTVMNKHYGLLFAIELSLENNQLVYMKENQRNYSQFYLFPFTAIIIKISLDGMQWHSIATKEGQTICFL